MSNSYFFTKHHLWISPAEEGDFIAGITDHAQQMLGDIVYVEPPAMGQRISAEQPCGLVESVKTASDLHAPLSGVVTGVNEAVINNPEMLDDAPEQHWIFRFKPDNADYHTLMDKAAYQAFVG